MINRVMNHLALFTDFKKKSEERIRLLEEKRALQKEFEMKVDALRKELELKVDALKKEIDENEKSKVIAPSPEERSVKIRWPEFLRYSSAELRMWRFCGEDYTKNIRWFCKGPGCPTGGHRKIYNQSITRKHYLTTLSHGSWRLCQECVKYEHVRFETLTKKRSPNSTRPPIDESTMIIIDPYQYSDIEVVTALLKLGGVL